MRLKSLIYMLEYMKNYSDNPVRYIECKSADAIEVVFDDNSALRLEWVNGTDICVFNISHDRAYANFIAELTDGEIRFIPEMIKMLRHKVAVKEAHDDKGQTYNSSDADE